MGLILEGLPAGMVLDLDAINRQLTRRQQGYGRGGRMSIEQDQVQVMAGLRHGRTLGSPLLLLVPNRDHANWSALMRPDQGDTADTEGLTVRVPRPGHADLPGAVKYGHRDLRNVLERASARETVNRVLAGAVGSQLLAGFGIQTGAHVLSLGPVAAALTSNPPFDLSAGELSRRADESLTRCLDPEASIAMVQAIDAAREAGDTLGGVLEVRSTGLPVGLGSHVHWDRRLDGRLGAALLSLPAVKGLEFGNAFHDAALSGRTATDAILVSDGVAFPSRAGNHQGGLEGGISTGQTLWLKLAMKPLSTLGNPLASVHLDSLEAHSAHRERSDVCALPALCVVAEHVVNWELARAVLEVWGADTYAEVQARFQREPERWLALLGPEG